jgi:hypothetical protein
MSLYDLPFVKTNGELLGENIEADVTFESDIAQVKTIPRGFSGITPGSPVVMVTIKNAVPISGQEYNFAKALVQSIPFEFEFQLGGSGESILLEEAWCIGPVKISGAVGKATEQDVTIVGRAPFSPFE